MRPARAHGCRPASACAATRLGDPAATRLGDPATTRSRHGDEWELYDLDADPGERHNLAGDPAHAGLEADLRARLEAARRRVDGAKA